MKPIAGDIVIAAPVEMVFDFVADEENEPRYNLRMLQAKKVTPGPIGVGTRYQAVMRAPRGGAPLTIEFTRFERPGLLASHTRTAQMDIDDTLTFSPEGDHTHRGLGDSWPKRRVGRSWPPTRR